MLQIFQFGLKIFKPVCVLFSFVSDYHKESVTKENKNETDLKIFKIVLRKTWVYVPAREKKEKPRKGLFV